MLALLSSAALLLQVAAATPGDSTRAERGQTSDSARRAARREANRVPVTAEHLRTAFASARARELLLRARAARLNHDSALRSYDANAYQRISAGMGLRRIGRDRLFFRSESAARVRWQRGVGARIDVTGQRTVLPQIGDMEAENDFDDTPSVPYYPGRETLWIGSGVAKAEVDPDELIHPIAVGSEAYYTYAIGDSSSFRLPDGTRIKLRELRVRPREPNWRYVVGSLWFDEASAQVVRAVYRLSIPIDLWGVVREDAERDGDEDDDVPGFVRAMLTPMSAMIDAVIVEYGLHEGRFWLPRAQSARGDAQAGMIRIPFRLEERFDYTSVNGTDTIPHFVVAQDGGTGRESGAPDSAAAMHASGQADSATADRDGIAAGSGGEPDEEREEREARRRALRAQ